MRKIIWVCMIIVSLFMFVSCAAQDNSDNTYDTETSDKVPVSQAWEGYEELLGNDYGVFIMPDKLEPLDADVLYSFQTELNIPYGSLVTEEMKADALRFAKIFFGDSFDAGELTVNDQINAVQYNGELGQMVYRGFPEGTLKGSVLDCLDNYENVFGAFRSGRDDDSVMQFEDGSCTVGEFCSNVQEYIDSALYPVYDGFDLFPYEIFNYYSSETGLKRAEIRCAARFKGVMLEEYFSPFSYYGNDPETGLIKEQYYIPFDIRIGYDSPTNPVYNFPDTAPRHAVDITEHKEIISLKQAVELLKDNLAPNMRFEFDDVRLTYCSMQTSLHNGEVGAEQIVDPTPYEPTWCFFRNSQTPGKARDGVKVNALTGEIIIDIR